jgi:hypothetical protein
LPRVYRDPRQPAGLPKSAEKKTKSAQLNFQSHAHGRFVCGSPLPDHFSSLHQFVTVSAYSERILIMLRVLGGNRSSSDRRLNDLRFEEKMTKITLSSIFRAGSRAACFSLFVLLAGLVFRQPVRASGIVYAAGLGLPEQIIPVTSNSGYAAGTLLVVDAASTSNNGISSIYAIPPGGGTPQLVASLPSGSDAYAAAFAPDGNLVVYGYSYIGSYGTSTAFTLFAGSRTFGVRYIDPNPNSVGYLAQAVTAPAGFGSIAGETLIGEEFFNGSTSTVEAFPSTPTPSTFATITNFAPANAQNDTGPAGLAFSSNGFIPGTTGQVLLVSDAFSGAIDWIDSSGNVNYFTTIPLIDNEFGLRQIAVAPSGFGSYGGDLLVSVAAVNGAGGTFGAVDVVDGAGNVIATLSQGALGAALNPRGLYFESSSQLLVANADPSIYSVSPSDFVAVPEPGTFGAVSLACGLGAVWFYFRSRSGRKVMSC